jgi:prepilin-type N-terminal cleavage/methylation domain-containing protein
MSGVSKRSGFTLIEALAAAVLLGVGVTAAMGGLASISRAEASARETEILRRLAAEKLDDVLGTRDVQGTGADGAFDDPDLAGYRWRLEVSPSGVENLERVRVTVEHEGREAIAEALLFSPPATGGVAGG